MWLFRVLVSARLPLRFPAVPFCLFWVVFRVRSVWAVLRVLIASSASVFRVSSFLVGGRVARASFALRSSALVSWCASRGGLLVAFPLGACPVGVAVSSSFRGCGSGSWGSVALALGLGCSVLVVSPVGVGSAWFGALASRFCCVGSAPCGGLLWVASSVPFPAPPVGGQLSLF